MTAAAQRFEHDPEYLARVAEWIKCSADPVYFISQYVKVRHPRDGVIPFTLWPWQANLIDTYLTEQQLVILKSRQLGVSEVFCAVALWLVLFHPGKTVLILSKNDEAAKDMLRRAKLGYDSLPDWLQAGGVHPTGRAPAVGDNNTERFEIVHQDAAGKPQPSVLRSLPASPSAGRSASSSLLILDEWAHQQFDHDIWAAIQPTVAAGGKIVGISTANGIGNVFHAVYSKARGGENHFTPVFLPWSKHPERDQAWYDRTKADLDQDWRMAQEHPTTESEAFLQSGRPVFRQQVLARHESRIRSESLPPLPIDAPPGLDDGVTVWRLPEPGHRYVLAADVAEGGPSGDYDAAVIVDRATHEELAEIHGRWDFDAYAQKLDFWGRKYNNALLAVERNNHGHAIILALVSGLAHGWAQGRWQDNAPAKYPNLYHHHEAISRNEREEPKPGWPTTTVTKPLAIDALGLGLREDTYLPRSLKFLAEAVLFAIGDNGKMGAPNGFHDDLVMCRAIAAFIVTQPSLGDAQMNYMAQWAQAAARRVPN